MINLCSRRERDDVMAVLADLSGRDMGPRFTNRIDTIVAAHAVTVDVVVIEVGRHEADRGMTVVAGITALDVGGRLARCGRAVVTAHAGSQNL